MNVIKNRILLIFTTYIIFTFNSQCVDGLKILGLFPLHGKSHFVMCESLVKGLVQRGHQVDVYSHFPQKVPIPNYKDYSLHGTLPGLVNNMSFEFFQQSPSMKIQLALKRVGNPICELMDTPVFQDLFERLKKDQPYDLIIIEVFLSNCFLAWGRYLKIPMIGVATTSLPDWLNEPLGNPINTAIEQSGWSGYFHPMNFWERLINTYKYHMRAIEYNYYMKDQNKYVEKYFGPGYPDVTELLKDLDLLLVNAHYTFDGIRPFTSAIIPVAGLHIFDDKTKLPNDVQDWLDKSKDGCIYFSFGSMVRIETFPKSILDAFYATFRNIAPVRVLLKIAKPEVLPPGLPSNVMTRPWFSQLQVLKHKNIKGFVTHGGLMSTQESLYAGVPMISVPLFGDQNLNAKSLAKKELAVMMELQYITEKTFTETVKDILNNPTYKMNAEKFSKKFLDRPLSAMDTAAFWIEYISRHGKGALKSPIVDMPWWESKLIDVYGFILIIFISIYLILKLILKRMKSCFISTDDKQKQNKKSKKYD